MAAKVLVATFLICVASSFGCNKVAPAAKKVGGAVGLGVAGGVGREAGADAYHYIKGDKQQPKPAEVK